MLLKEKLPFIKFKNRSHIIVDKTTRKTYYYNKLIKDRISPILLNKEYVKMYLNYIVVEDREKVRLKTQLQLLSDDTRISLVLPSGEIREYKNKHELAEKIKYKDAKKFWVYKVSVYEKTQYDCASISIFVRGGDLDEPD